jgi:thymidylate synthase
MWWDEWDIGDGTIGQRYGATVKKWFIEYSIRWS